MVSKLAWLVTKVLCHIPIFFGNSGRLVNERKYTFTENTSSVSKHKVSELPRFLALRQRGPNSL